MVLRSDSPSEVRALAKIMESMRVASAPALQLERAIVEHVTAAGMGGLPQGLMFGAVGLGLGLVRPPAVGLPVSGVLTCLYV